ncbi:MAG: hypothetical protein CL678_15955 [Bdellovibrionaceae bacterium]|nr:hypothetical protein [Pseudobdellovibrionaceae bacterium]|tara:strand:- start:230 stop:463 length:234 start_codon:yes stop_codon:yes gene_type:complete
MIEWERTSVLSLLSPYFFSCFGVFFYWVGGTYEEGGSLWVGRESPPIGKPFKSDFEIDSSGTLPSLFHRYSDNDPIL